MALRIHRKAEGRLRKDRTRGACGGAGNRSPRWQRQASAAGCFGPTQPFSMLHLFQTEVQAREKVIVSFLWPLSQRTTNSQLKTQTGR